MIGAQFRAAFGFSLPVALAVVIAAVSGLAGTLVFYAMLDKVNARLPENERFSDMGFWWGKSRRITALYSQFFPDGHLLWA